METYEIKWTSRAKNDLRKVYEFYVELAGEEKAFEIITSIIALVGALSDARFVRMGPTDEQFRHLKHQYKKLIDKNVKVTYRLSVSKPVVYINRVFETRQHPSKNF